MVHGKTGMDFGRKEGSCPWLDDLYGKAMDAYSAFHRKAQGVYIWAKIADLVLAFLSNAIAYAYLIGLVIQDGLSVAEFLLFFTAVVGLNGAGKTTLIKLICGFLDPTEGEILLNGINIRKYSYVEYMMIFSVVF